MDKIFYRLIIYLDDLAENREVMPEIGQRARLSKGDIMQTMALYGCPGDNFVGFFCLLKSFQNKKGQKNLQVHRFLCPFLSCQL